MSPSQKWLKSLEAYSVTMAKNYYLDRLKSKQAQNLSLDERYGGSVSDSLTKKIEQRDDLNWVGKLIDELRKRANDHSIKRN